MTRLTIPVGVSLLSIERLADKDWAIWIHTNGNELRKSHEERNGTFLHLKHNGSVDRTTISGGCVVDLIEVLPQSE
jgi:hypothetical protein